MPRMRKPVASLMQKRVYQEANSTCAFCPESSVAALQVHHIDEDPSNNSFENLILTCANCHTKITAGAISMAEVLLKKEQLANSHGEKRPRRSPDVTIINSTFKGDIANNLIKIVTPHPPRLKHPEGSIGADLLRKGYIDYLIRQYCDFRKADASYGRECAFSYSVLHRNIQRHFGYKTFFIPVTRFHELTDYLKSNIDKTIQGKANSKRGFPNYHSYEEHSSRYS